MKSLKTPIFVFQPEKLKENYADFNSLCKKYFSKFKIAYSVKTNSNKEVIEILSKLNSGFEIASLSELKSVPKHSFIVFNSPAKTQDELKLAIKNKLLINIDSKSEIDKIARITKGKKIEAGLRISIEESKFGVEDSEIEQIINYAKSKGIEIICIHIHQGTQLTLKEYEASIIIFENILERISKKINLKYIDIGGGIPDKQQLKNLNLSLNNYLEVIAKHLEKFKATIILEPGRSLVSDAFFLLTKVIAVKENFNKTYAILDAGINLLPKITLASYKFSRYDCADDACRKASPHDKDLLLDNNIKYEAEKDFAGKQNKIVKNSDLITNNKQSKEYLLAGPLLFSNDILGKFQGSLKEGDIIKVENVGAYCYNLAWEISYKKPKIICK